MHGPPNRESSAFGFRRKRRGSDYAFTSEGNSVGIGRMSGPHAISKPASVVTLSETISNNSNSHINI